LLLLAGMLLALESNDEAVPPSMIEEEEEGNEVEGELGGFKSTNLVYGESGRSCFTSFSPCG